MLNTISAHAAIAARFFPGILPAVTRTVSPLVILPGSLKPIEAVNPDEINPRYSGFKS